MNVQVFDENGTSVTDRKGELVCVQPAPSMPRGFRNDPDARRYRAEYFDRFPGVWAHGDYAERTSRGTFIIYGRSDAVLNPGGVRIGTAEIYRYVDCIPGVLASVAVGLITTLVAIWGSATIQADIFKAPENVWFPFRNPAIITVPLSFAVAVAVSMLTRKKIATLPVAAVR